MTIHAIHVNAPMWVCAQHEHGMVCGPNFGAVWLIAMGLFIVVLGLLVRR